MIDLRREEIIRIDKIPRRLPPNRRGKPIHLSTVYRWTAKGVAGVKLEIVRLGGIRYSSIEALERFMVARSTPNTTTRRKAVSR